MTPRILFLDIENFPLKILSWGVYEQNALSIEEHSIICSFSAKWFNGKHITKALPDYPNYRPRSPNDKKLIKDLWKLIDEAEIIVAQNGDRFDIPKINARFIFHNLPPPSDYKTIDTLKAAKRTFRFDSNKLDDLAGYLGLGRKLETGGFGLWKQCMEGDLNAWRLMKKYNKYDVVLLEKVYLKLRPFIKNHPAIGVFTGKFSCPKCGSSRVISRGYHITTSGKHRRYQCTGCGGWGRVSTKGSPIVSI